MRRNSAGVCLAAGCFAALQADPVRAADDPLPPTHTAASAVAGASPQQLPKMPAPPPAGVAGARVVHPGRVMLNYTYVRSTKNQLVKGDDNISTRKVATQRNHFAGRPGQPATYRNAPENMTMQTHLFGVQAGITEDLSAMFGIPYVIKERTSVTFSGPSGTTRLASFENETSGIGDVSLAALYRLYDDTVHHVHLMAGLSFPTGSIRETGRTINPNGASQVRRLPYGMQLGTGTYNLLPGLTYWGEAGRWNWGLQALGRVTLGDNDAGYSFGDSVVATGWGGYSLGYGFTVSVRLIQEYTGDIDGEDDLVTGPSPVTDPNNYGGWKTSAAFGVEYRVPEGPLMGLTPGVEIGVPLYQNLNGPQLKDAWTLFAGVRRVFIF